MAKKSRAPRPPRPVQAPKRRDAPTERRLPVVPGPRWAWLVGVAAVAAIVAAVLAMSGGSKNSTASVKAAMVASGCTYREVKPYPPKNKTNYHADVPKLTTSTKGLWATYPPSGGGHYGLWAVWGFYTDPVNPRQVVHNEEHGAVVLWWGPKVPASTVNELEAFYNEQPVGMFGTPIAGLGSKIALTSWTGDTARYYRKGYYGIGHIAICPRFDEHAFKVFRDAYRGQGPEGIPLSLDKPGMGPG
jgi:hypothetical protein